MTTDSPLASEFIPAHFFKTANRTSIDIVCLHSTESPANSARAVANYFHGLRNTVASSTYIVGADAVIQSVREKDIPDAAPPDNVNGIHIELCGYHTWGWRQWVDSGVLGPAAKLFADVAHRWSVPIVLLNADDLIAGKRGITTHAAISRAFKKTNHVDPGAGFDMAAFLLMVADELPEAEAAPCSS